MPGIGVGIGIPFRKHEDESSYWKTLPETVAIVAAMTDKPTDEQQVEMGRFIWTLKQGGVWAKLDLLYVFAAHTNDNGEALINWINPATAATLTNGAGGQPPVFKENWGFRGSIANKSIIDTGFNPTTANGKFTLNEASMGVYLNDVNYYIGGEPNHTAIGIRNSGRTYLKPNYSTNSDVRGTISTNAGSSTTRTKSFFPVLYSVVRKNATTICKYKDGVAFADETDAVYATLPNGNISILSGEDYYYMNNQVAMAYSGGLLSTDDLTLLSSSFKTYYNGANVDTAAVMVSDADDTYAHESQILIKQIGGVDYLFVIYRGDKNTTNEWGLNAKARLKVFNLSTMALVKSYDIGYAGIVAGVTLPIDEELGTPRGYFIGDYLRVYFCNTSALYVRSIDISSSDPNDWAFGNIAIAQMTMKNALGVDTLSNVTSANIQTHLENVLSDTNDGYEDLMPQFRQLNFVKDGSNWITTMDLSSERSHSLGHIGIIINSADAGDTFSFGSLVHYATDDRLSFFELDIAELGGDIHVIARSAPTPNTSANPVYHFKSEDGGATFTQLANMPFDVITAKPFLFNADSTTECVFALNVYNEIIGGNYLNRNTIDILKTSDFVNYERINKSTSATFMNYPCLCYYGGRLYMSYSKGINTGVKDAIYFTTIY